MNNASTKLAMLASLASLSYTSGWRPIRDKSVPCNFPRSREEVIKKHKADKARKAAKKARRRNRRK